MATTVAIESADLQPMATTVAIESADLRPMATGYPMGLWWGLLELAGTFRAPGGALRPLGNRSWAPGGALCEP